MQRVCMPCFNSMKVRLKRVFMYFVKGLEHGFNSMKVRLKLKSVSRNVIFDFVSIP